MWRRITKITIWTLYIYTCMRIPVHIHIHVYTCVYKGFAFCFHPVVPSDRLILHNHISPILLSCAGRKGQILPIPFPCYTALHSTALLHPATEDLGLAEVSVCQWDIACTWPSHGWWYWPHVNVHSDCKYQEAFFEPRLCSKRKDLGQTVVFTPFLVL